MDSKGGIGGPPEEAVVFIAVQHKTWRVTIERAGNRPD